MSSKSMESISYHTIYKKLHSNSYLINISLKKHPDNQILGHSYIHCQNERKWQSRGLESISYRTINKKLHSHTYQHIIENITLTTRLPGIPTYIFNVKENDKVGLIHAQVLKFRPQQPQEKSQKSLVHWGTFIKK